MIQFLVMTDGYNIYKNKIPKHLIQQIYKLQLNRIIHKTLKTMTKKSFSSTVE